MILNQVLFLPVIRGKNQIYTTLRRLVGTRAVIGCLLLLRRRSHGLVVVINGVLPAVVLVVVIAFG